MSPSSPRSKPCAGKSKENSVRSTSWWRTRAAASRNPVLSKKRARKGEDVARAARFLASDDAAWITGIVLDVAGGGGLGVFYSFKMGRARPCRFFAWDLRGQTLAAVYAA